MNKEAKEVSLYGEKYLSLKKCMFTDNQGNKCQELATWLHRNGRIYCDGCHGHVNKINKERQQEFIAELKENINKQIDLWVKNLNSNIEVCVSEKNTIPFKSERRALKIFQNMLNNGEFDVSRSID